MQLVIPMSGKGERFKAAGYRLPKPLIIVEGKRIIEHVLDMFPPMATTFICNESHIQDPDLNLENTLHKLRPSASIVSIPEHKLGPVHALNLAADFIDKDEPTIVSYCDFSCIWDFQKFLNDVERSQCDGAIVGYKGFHPHTIRSTNVGYSKVADGWVQEVKEKASFTSNPLNEFASCGTYFFGSGAILTKYSSELEQQGKTVNGEYYVSLIYQLMIENNCAIRAFEIDKFMQWGTPEDLEDFVYWSQTFRKLSANKTTFHSHKLEDENVEQKVEDDVGLLVMPLAGKGQRFKDSGFIKPKPLLDVLSRPMVCRAADAFSDLEHKIFITRQDDDALTLAPQIIKNEFPSASFVKLKTLTDGQASTVYQGIVNYVAGIDEKDQTKKITVSACDSFIYFQNQKKVAQSLKSNDWDLLIWGISDYRPALINPTAYGWVKVTEDGQHVKSAHVKTKPPTEDNVFVMTGNFSFGSINTYKKLYKEMIKRNIVINEEYYIDSMVGIALETGLSCRVIPIDAWLNWGTPDELSSFLYWNEGFTKWEAHPYTAPEDC